jgi:metal-responsive CopG/Arc/MetJ family transcriptional regulator
MDAIHPPSDDAASRHDLPVLELRVRVPASLVEAIDALVGKRYVGGRSEAVRALLHSALNAEGGER